MKKTAMRVSGNITLILFFLLFLVSVLGVCVALQVTSVTDVINSSSILNGISTLILIVFVTIPVYLLGLTGIALPAEISTIFAIVSAVFCFLMFLWGIKEVTIANRDNKRFAKCKKTCGFMMFIKFMFFAYLLAVIIVSVLIEDVANLTLFLTEILNVPYIFLISTAILAVFAFIIFVLPVANISVVYNAVRFGEDYEEPQNQQNTNVEQPASDSQELQSFYSQAPQPTMQANMPPMPGYKPQVVVQTASQQSQPQMSNQTVAQPMPNSQVSQQQVASQPTQNAQQVQPSAYNTVQPQVNQTVQTTPVQPMQQTAQPVQTQPIQPTSVQPMQTQTAQQTNVSVQPASAPVQPQVTTNAQAPAGQSGIVPGQDGVPENITEKGIADLQRLERLKSMGAITPENYAAMKQKICSTNIG